jgi:hypothetical protein
MYLIDEAARLMPVLYILHERSEDVMALGNTTGPGNPHGFPDRVSVGTGTGWMSDTRWNPIPAAQIAGKPVPACGYSRRSYKLQSEEQEKEKETMQAQP